MGRMRASYKDLSPRQREIMKTTARLEQKEHQQGAVMAALIADPFASVAELARESGMTRPQINGIKRKLQTKFLAPAEALRKITQAQLLATTEDRLIRTVEAIDEVAIKTASLRDKAYTVDVLFKNRQLMKGEPTAIMSVDDRRQLNELLPALLREAQRRGVIIDGHARVVAEPERGLPEMGQTLPPDDSNPEPPTSEAAPVPPANAPCAGDDVGHFLPEPYPPSMGPTSLLEPAL